MQASSIQWQQRETKKKSSSSRALACQLSLTALSPELFPSTLTDPFPPMLSLMAFPMDVLPKFPAYPPLGSKVPSVARSPLPPLPGLAASGTYSRLHEVDKVPPVILHPLLFSLAVKP